MSILQWLSSVVGTLLVIIAFIAIGWGHWLTILLTPFYIVSRITKDWDRRHWAGVFAILGVILIALGVAT